MAGMSGSITVLHVDDDRDFVELAATALEAENDRLRVITTTDTDTATDRVAAGDVDCVVSDYEMPGSDGISFLESVRRLDADLPFILFTGKGSEEVASDAISAGVTDYLQKRPGSSQFAVLANRIENAVERHQAERERHQWERAIETATQGIAIIDADGVYRQLNAAYAGVYDADPADLIGTNWREWYPPEEVERFESEVLPQVHEEGAWSGESVGLRVDGTCVDESLSLSRLDDGGHVCVAEDISDRKARERALERERARMELAIRATDSYIYEIDLETGEEWRFGDWTGLHGLPADAAPTTEAFIERGVHPADRDFLREKHEELQQGDRDAVEWEYRTNPEEGDPRWLRTELTLHRDADGEPQRAIGLATDVTSQKEREIELRRQNERLDQFSSLVSHDLRNPLNVARGRVELARAEHDTEHLESAAAALERMSGLIDDLLALARYGEAVQSPEPVTLATVAEQCWQTVSTDQASLEIETVAVVRADRGRLRQVLENLIRNAVDHAGPAVTVRVGDLEEGFYVEDDGPGIPEDRREQVFEHGHSTAPAGNGFGLTIVKQIAEAHDWAVRATEAAAGGARIEVTGVERVESAARD